MAGTIWGALNLNDADDRFINTIGQQTVWDAIQLLLMEFNADLAAARAIFVEETTTLFQETYKLPGGGYLQKVGSQGQPGARKVEGSWDVAYALEEFGDQLAGDRVDMAYMTLPELNRHLQSVFARARNTMRKEILKAVFPNTAWTFKDQTGHGTLTVKPLANGDTDLYSPVYGSEDSAIEDHYLESGYAAASISDSNNPITTIVDDLEHHFGGPDTFGANVAIFINNAQRAKIKALANFNKDGMNRFENVGTDVTTVTGLPQGLPGKLLGYADAWIVEWPFIPANYMFGIHLDAPKPLKMRVDPAEVGLGSGELQLVQEDEVYPFKGSFYSQRYGFGVANRLNGVFLELGTGGTFSIPSGYTR